jgi:hypothetical protein
MKKLLVILKMLFFFFGIIGLANAALVDHGNYSSCDATGLDWLEIVPTVNISYNDMILEFESGGLWEGWRHASIAEFEAMLGGIGGVPPYEGQSSNHNYVAPIFFEHFGTMFTGPGPGGIDTADTTIGLLSDLAPGSVGDPTSRHYGAAVIDYYGNFVYYDSIDVRAHQILDSWASPSHGHFLVRNTIVPIPGAFWLFGSGLIGIVGIGGKFKK